MNLRNLTVLFNCGLLLVSCNATEKSASTSPTDVPAWAKEAVWYQIFPERFRNGDATNDPRIDDLTGSWPHDVQTEWNISSWTGDWYALQPWERANGRDFYYNSQLRRYGGDLQGIIDKLDYLKELGVSALYINPVFESPSLHKYDATMYHHIDNNFGPDPDGDRKIWESEDPADPSTWKWTSADKLFLEFLQQAHKRNIRVIIDGVFNHVGMTFWAFKDVQRNGEQSPYKDWFIIKQFDDPATPENEFDYEGWYGVRELPEIREDENGIVAGPRKHIHEIVKRWMDPDGDGDPSDGIDGWRLDVAEMVAIPFWKDFRRWVREINPEAYLVGEVWWEDWNNEKMFNADPWLRGDVFDAVMNYRLAREAGYFFKGKRSKISATEFLRRLDSLRAEYRSDVNYVLLNLFDSHDTDRLASQIVNPDTKYDKRVSPKDDASYDVRKPTSEELRTLRMMVLFQMTYIGAPGIFYGGEAGMWGADDPDERKPMLWPDLTYAAEESHPFGKSRPRDENVVDTALHAFYTSCIHMRRNSKALMLGSITTLLTDDAGDVLSFERKHEAERVVVVMNNSEKEQTVSVPLRSRGVESWKVLFGVPIYTIDGATLQATLSAKSALVVQGWER